MKTRQALLFGIKQTLYIIWFSLLVFSMLFLASIGIYTATIARNYFGLLMSIPIFFLRVYIDMFLHEMGEL